MNHLSRFSVPFAFLLLVGCSSPSDSKDDPIKVETKSWVVNGEDLQFSTNDSKNLEQAFSYIYEAKDSSATFQGFTGVTSKRSGSGRWPYGFVFAGADANHRYEVLISTTGYFRVDKIVEGERYGLLDWTEHSALRTGYNTENTVRVQTSGTETFTIFLNDVAVFEFNDPDYTSDSFGAIVAIGGAEDEDFPGVPVDVRFRFTAPEKLPSGARLSRVDHSGEAELPIRGIEAR